MLDRGGGSIVNIIGAMVYLGRPNHAHSYGTKFAIEGLTRQLASEFGRDGVRVNAVSPGLIEVGRDQTDEWGTDEGRDPRGDAARSNRNCRRDRRRLFICSVRSSVVRYWAGTSRQRWNVSDPEDITGSLVDRGGRFHRQRPPDPPSGSIASLEPQPDGFEGRSVVACPSVDLHSECATRRSADSESERPRPRVD